MMVKVKFCDVHSGITDYIDNRRHMHLLQFETVSYPPSCDPASQIFTSTYECNEQDGDGLRWRRLVELLYAVLGALQKRSSLRPFASCFCISLDFRYQFILGLLLFIFQSDIIRPA